MFTNNRAETIIPGKTDNRVINASKELAELGSIKEALLAEIKRGEEKALAYKDIDEKVEKAEKEINRLSPLVVDLKSKLSQLDKAKEELGIAQATLIEVDSATKTIYDGNAKLLEIKNAIENEISIKKAELQSANLLYEKNIKAHEEDMEKMSNEAKKIDEENKKKIKDYSEIIETKIKTANELEQASDGWQKKIATAEARLKVLETEIEKANKEAMQLIANADDYSFKVKNEADEYAVKVKEELDKRDGELSDRSKFLDVRENFLRDVKSQLEDKLGKKIDNLVF